MSVSHCEDGQVAGSRLGAWIWRVISIIGLAGLALAGCGGGGGSSATSDTLLLALSNTSIAVSAGITGSAPTAYMQISVQATTASTPTTSIYILRNETHNGLESTAGSANGEFDQVTLLFKAPSTLGLGTYTDTMTVKACYDQACSRQLSNSPQTVSITYTVTQPQPNIVYMNPTAVTAGAAGVTLDIHGSNFTANSAVLWNGSPRATTYVSSGNLTAQITAADVAAAGNYSVTIDNGGGATSNAVIFIVQPLDALGLSAISPSQVVVGGSPFMLSVVGTGFTSESAITWNGTSLTTTYMSSTLLRASVSAAQIANTGTASIAVVRPGDQGGTSTALNLTIAAPTVDAVSYQMNPAHTGSVNFQSVSLPASSQWSVDVGGPASYALIVGGRVIVTSAVNGNSQLTALDASTGGVIWGPIAFPGTANATYDNGLVFVTSGSWALPQALTAIEAATGNTKWSRSVDGSSSPAPPVAAGGIVYTLTTGFVEAFDETSGGELWRQNVSGTDGTVAVSVDGVYTSAPCTTYDLQPLVGAVIWTVNTGCFGGGGLTPVVSNGVVYSPIGNSYSGTSYDAEAGVALGTFTASQLPALTATTGYWLQNSSLQAIARSDNQVQWSFAGDGTLVGSPVVVNNYVFVGSSSGNLYAVDASTGHQIWDQNLGAAIHGGINFNDTMYSGLAAGGGLLVVPSGDEVTAYLLSANP